MNIEPTTLSDWLILLGFAIIGGILAGMLNHIIIKHIRKKRVSKLLWKAWYDYCITNRLIAYGGKFPS